MDISASEGLAKTGLNEVKECQQNCQRIQQDGHPEGATDILSVERASTVGIGL
jgi:hypothetical protein